jgi:hypothetical protein
MDGWLMYDLFDEAERVLNDMKMESYFETPIRVVSGYVRVSEQRLAELRRDNEAWRELEWIATHYDEATPDQRLRLDRTLAAIRSIEAACEY